MRVTLVGLILTFLVCAPGYVFLSVQRGVSSTASTKRSRIVDLALHGAPFFLLVLVLWLAIDGLYSEFSPGFGELFSAPTAELADHPIEWLIVLGSAVVVSSVLAASAASRYVRMSASSADVLPWQTVFDSRFNPRMVGSYAEVEIRLKSGGSVGGLVHGYGNSDVSANRSLILTSPWGQADEVGLEVDNGDWVVVPAEEIGAMRVRFVEQT